MKKVTLKNKFDRRFHQGHPWIYSNEINSDVQIPSGSIVELVNEKGHFLGVGFYNSHSLIAFRLLSQKPLLEDWVFLVIQKAFSYRQSFLGLQKSHRAFYSQADGISGLIIDCYKTDQKTFFVVQAQTAGADGLLPEVIEALKRLNETAVILVRNDTKARLKDGLELIPAYFAHGEDASLQKIGCSSGDFFVDLFSGQKTGFFLDQSRNVELVKTLFSSFFGEQKVVMLDLCSYVGQWSCALSSFLDEKSCLVDSSKACLDLAKRNLGEKKLNLIQRDLFDALKIFKEDLFDVVIADPPAFIKSKKDLLNGRNAYLRCFLEVLRVLKSRGIVVFCSCSGLLTKEQFAQIVTLACHKSGRTGRFIWGSQALDHPLLCSLPETEYLKVLIGIFD